MNDQRIAILTDTGTNTPAEFVRDHDVRVVPLLINYHDRTYKSGEDIDTAEVVRRFAQEIPTTSLPTPQQIMALVEQARDDGYERGVFVTISGTLSATNQTVHMVSHMVKDFPLVIIDSKSIGVVAGMVVMRAAQMVEEGVPFGELEARLNDLAEKSDVFFATKTLDYLFKGGRIGLVTYRLGSVLNVKPIITCDPEGRYVVARKVRGWDRAISAQVQLVRERAQQFRKVRVGICCTEGNDLFEPIEAQLREHIDNIVDVIRSGLSPDLVVHTGPDMVGIGIQPA